MASCNAQVGEIRGRGENAADLGYEKTGTACQGEYSKLWRSTPPDGRTRLGPEGGPRSGCRQERDARRRHRGPETQQAAHTRGKPARQHEGTNWTRDAFIAQLGVKGSRSRVGGREAVAGGFV